MARDEEASPPARPVVALEEDAEFDDDFSGLNQPHATGRPRSERIGTIVAISVGGFLGANARYLASLWAAERWGMAFPWGTLLINVAGSFVLGFYLTLVTERFIGRPTTRLFLGTGFLGAFTTFSTFSFEVVQFLERGAPTPAVAYVAGSLVLGLAAAIVGILCAHAL